MDHDDDTIRHTIGELSIASHCGGVDAAASSDSALSVGPPCVGWNRGPRGRTRCACRRGCSISLSRRSVVDRSVWSCSDATDVPLYREQETVARRADRAARRQRLRPLAHPALVRTAARALHRGSAKNVRLLALVRGAAGRRREALHRYRQGAAPVRFDVLRRADLGTANGGNRQGRAVLVRRQPAPTVPATTWGLLDEKDPPRDVRAGAWDFPRLGIEHAARIGGWPRT